MNNSYLRVTAAARKLRRHSYAICALLFLVGGALGYWLAKPPAWGLGKLQFARLQISSVQPDFSGDECKQICDELRQIDEAVRHLIWSYECGHSLQQGTMVALLWLREVANHYQLAVKQGDEEQAKYLHSVLEACQRIVTRVQ